jgi:hypothetical protein
MSDLTTQPKKKSNKWKWIGLVIAVVFVIAAFGDTPKPSQTNKAADPSPSPSPIVEQIQAEVTQEPQSPQPSPTPEVKAFEVVNVEDRGIVQNVRVYVTSKEVSEEKMNEMANSIKSSHCTKQCNIDFYDTKKAIELKSEFDKLYVGEASALEAWKQKNYMYLADHNLAYYYFDVEELVMYPLKDAQYEKYKQ